MPSATPSSALPTLVASAMGAAVSRRAPTFFFSSTLMALASLRKMALPQSRSRREVNWYHFHFLKAQRASSNSRSVHCTVGTWRDGDAATGREDRTQRCLEDPQSSSCSHREHQNPALTFILRFLLFLVCLRVIPRVHLLLQSLQFALIVLGEAGRGVMEPTRCDLPPCGHTALPPPRTLAFSLLWIRAYGCNPRNNGLALVFRTSRATPCKYLPGLGHAWAAGEGARSSPPTSLCCSRR